ncbi:helix-turn-helix domain-containing protein [Photobacterium sanguinicancri]|uniref:helix-turn-helix domain-containing protein n=1 Tax=Photobacterium sanguinicancri TaxID=875932 RepID=UPI002480C83B|nr:helix-turn-helix transcriptional regulator [Photobacterium sanguinicancri]
MDRLNGEICERLKRHLKLAGISYKTLATEMALSEVSVKRLLNQQQPLSITRIAEIAELVQTPLSSIIAEAEKAIAVPPLFTLEQDLAFCERPELYTLLITIIDDKADAKALMAKYELNEPSMYLYLRLLEKLGLIVLISGMQFKLTVPRHIAFSDSSNFSMHFKNQIINNLQAQIQTIVPSSKTAYFITSRLRLTEDEFRQYNVKLEEMMFEALKLSQTRDASTANTNEYTIIDIGAQGNYQPEHKKPMNLTTER